MRRFLSAILGRLTNSIRTKDDRLFKTGISGWENAMNHNIPVSATFYTVQVFAGQSFGELYGALVHPQDKSDV